MSFQSLNAALSGLRVAQQQLTVISNNVSNATTPGYTRKILPQSSQVVNSTGQIIGVQSETMIRHVDMNLQKELWTQVSGASELDIKASYLDKIEKFHGATQSERSIAAEISRLKDSFAALSDSPANGSLQQSAVAQAQTVATKFNEFGKLLNEMRNDAQDEMAQTVDRVNALLSSIAELNGQIKGTANLNRSVAGIQDQRDEAVKELSTLLNITSFTRGDGVIVIQTTTGVQLADERPVPVYFNPGRIGSSTTYPDSVAGIFVGGDPARTRATVDITTTNVGGKLGGLIDLRDNILVQYQAQTDELAHKLALRLESQGLMLFTDPTGRVPLDTPPDFSVDPPVPVTYVGFASVIQVNPNIRNNVSLIQQGTYNSDMTIPGASNEVIRRVIEFGFGDVQYQQVAGSTDLNIAAPATDMQQWLGLYSRNNVVGGIDFRSFTQLDDGLPSTNDLADQLEGYFPNWPADAQFQITFQETRLGLGPSTVNVDLGTIATNPAYAIGSPGINNALDQIMAGINDAITAAGVPADLAASVSTNTNGQLVFQSRGNITLDASSFPGAMGATAFGAMGLQERTYTTEDPYFDIQVGSGSTMRITIEPGDDINSLIDKLEYDAATGTGVPGLHVEFDALTGNLTLRPGIDDSNGGPHFGGDIKIVAGPGVTTGAINPALAALPAGVSIASALFGSYSVSGGTVTQTSPVTDVAYGSETYAGSGVYVAFRRDHLGPGADRSTNILTGSKIIDFGQKMVNAQAQDIIMNNTAKADTSSLRDLLQERHLNETGVNIDEELSMLIVIQTAYAAAARAVSAADEMFQELLNSV